MPDLDLKTAQTIVDAALKTARDKGFKPLSVAVYDARGAIRALASEDGTSLKRAEIAMGKAYGALALGVGSRAIHKMAVDRPFFVAAATHAVGGQLVPVPGGVLIKDAAGAILGAVGISGDTSDNDELAAASGIEAAGLVFDAGA
ncbi:GlcG/HbpS family heme-binding protein [Microvirga flavescens]|uniref:GlcG/HbpS family heme-binding protein n=1 Tax=Microvirga flavescens TaxID=2249811 RepID=UPI000DD68F47|nr:heme-binding protein [Microvirga flavescens]